MKFIFLITTLVGLLFADMGIALSNVNIREDASVNSSKVGLLIEDDVVDILSAIPNKYNPEWYQTDRGYIYANALSVLHSEPISTSAIALKNVNIRQKPSTRALKLGLLKEGEKVDVLSAIPSKNNPEWYETNKGYIYANSLDIYSGSSIEQAVVIKNVNLREKPSTKSLKLGLLKEGEKVEILSVIPNKDNPEWYETNKGYVYAKGLLIDNNSNYGVKKVADKSKKVKFLSTQELRDLLINKSRVGKTRYFKNGEYFKSKFKLDGTVDTTIYSKEGHKIEDIQESKWVISSNAFCIVTNNEILDISCRKVFKDENNVYISVLMSDKNIWSKFIIE